MDDSVIFARKSARIYEDKPVEEDKIDRILHAAMSAPSAKNQQPWEFFVVKDKALLKKLAKVTPYSSPAGRAPVVIVPCYRTEGLAAPMFAQIDLAIAQQNIWLETEALGLGGVWMGIAPIEAAMKAVEEILHIPNNLRAFSLFAFGYSRDKRVAVNRYEADRVHVIE